MATFSKWTLRTWRVLSDWSTLTPIGHLFEDNGIGLPPPEVAEDAVQGIYGQRRGLTAQYVASLVRYLNAPPRCTPRYVVGRLPGGVRGPLREVRGTPPGSCRAARDVSHRR